MRYRRGPAILRQSAPMFPGGRKQLDQPQGWNPTGTGAYVPSFAYMAAGARKLHSQIAPKRIQATPAQAARKAAPQTIRPVSVHMNGFLVKLSTNMIPVLAIKGNENRVQFVVVNNSAQTIIMSYGSFLGNTATKLYGRVILTNGSYEEDGTSCSTDDIYLAAAAGAPFSILCWEGIPTK